ncbi:MAG TPA: hypothetical protein VIT42_16795 [Microlunatus sp.]
MKINWAALGQVAAVSIFASVVFVVLLAGGIRFVSAARVKTNQGGSGTMTLSLGYAFIGLAGLLVLFGIWLIVPQLH